MIDQPQYQDALKLGQKEYRLCTLKGEDPELPVLDELLEGKETCGEVDLGVISIPADFIAGTKTAGRSGMFARNFMPVAPEGTEFAYKWEQLCRSHLEEGIREPVKAYEYMGRYYIAEGNKRVSVLKFFKAVSIPGRVIRILPAKDGSKDSQRYYAFLDFCKTTGISFIEFSKVAGYDRLIRLTGKQPDQAWTKEEQSRFSSLYYTFKDACASAGIKSDPVAAADAMLGYLEIYGYEALKSKSFSQIKKDLLKVRDDVSLQQTEQPVSVKLDPSDKKAGLLTKVLSVTDPKVIKAAFIHDGDAEHSAWIRGHEEGRLYAEAMIGSGLYTSAYNNAMASNPEAVLERAVREGNTLLFTTSSRLFNAALKTAVAHPEVMVFNCSLGQSHRYVRTYYARMYEVKFLIGAIAGAMAAAGETLGYVGDYPIRGQIAGVNAFAAGVQLVNPYSKVCVEWTSTEQGTTPLERLKEKGIRLISLQDQRPGKEQDREVGLVMFEEEGKKNLAVPLWNWGVYYQKIAKAAAEGTLKDEKSQSEKALNDYWGLSSGIVDLRLCEDLPSGVRKLAGLLRKGIIKGVLEPFADPLMEQDGTPVPPGMYDEPEEVIEMDFLLDNVIGKIPEYEELTEKGKATVEMTGVASSSKMKKEA